MEMMGCVVQDERLEISRMHGAIKRMILGFTFQLSQFAKHATDAHQPHFPIIRVTIN